MTRALTLPLAALVLLEVASPHEARAFDYTEHVRITKLALDDVLARHPNAASRFMVVREVLDSSHTCSGGALFDESPADCLSLCDVPALSGDHAASPLFVKWRWFDDCVPPREQIALPFKLPTIVYEIYEKDQSPEQVKVGKPDIEGFMALRESKSSRYWPLKDAISDIDLQDVDDAYTQLAERGHPHFRPRVAGAAAALAAARRTYVLDEDKRERHKPENDAYAWYADLHWGALRFASAARHTDDEERARFLTALALYLELTSLHYIQDGVSAGHIVPDASHLQNPSLNLTHDAYCNRGIDVDRPTGLCEAWTPSHVTPFICSAWDEICAPRNLGYARIVGDHRLARGEDPHDVTLTWAVGVSALSMDEVFRVLDGDSVTPDSARIADLPAQIAPADTTCIDDLGIQDDVTFKRWKCNGYPGLDPGPKFELQKVALGWQPALYRCLSYWWETKTPLEVRRREIADAFDLGFFQALRYLPQPTETAKLLAEHELWSGGGIDVGLAVLGQRRNGEFRAFPMLRTGVTYGPPRHIVPIAVELFGEVAFGRALEDDISDQSRIVMRAGPGGGFRAFWGTLPIESQVDVSADWAFYKSPKPYAHVHVVPIEGAVVDRQVLNLGIAPTLDYFADLGFAGGIQIDAAMWLDR